jgi:site-specific DNA recombinase
VLVGAYEDRATGANTDRPGLQRALAAARQKEFDVLLIYRVDRLSRRVIHMHELASELEANDVALVSATEPFDTTNPIGRFIMNLLATFAEYERDVLQDRIRRGQKERRRKGKRTGSLPTGMKEDADGVPTADEEWLPMIVAAMEMYAYDLLGSTTIAKRLSEAGWTTKAGNRINSKMVLKWLACPTYVALLRDDGELIPGDWEPVIDRRLWDKVQKILAERGEHPYLRRGNVSDYILAGLGRCRKCKATYIGKSANGRGGRYDYYVCQNRNNRADNCDNDNLPRDAYEVAVLNELLALLADTNLLLKAFKAAKAAQRRSLKDVTGDRERLKRRIVGLEHKRARYFEAFENGTMNAELCSARLTQLNEEIDTASADLLVIETRLREADVDFPAETIETARDTLETLFASGNEDPLSEEEAATAKAVLRLLIKQISIGGRDDITVTYRLPVGTTKEAVRTISPEVEAAGIEPASAAAPAEHLQA